jgi:hypothetical protein
LSVVKAIFDIQGVLHGHGKTLDLGDALHNLNNVLGRPGEVHNLKEVEETLEDDLLVSGVLVVFLEKVGVVQEVLLNFQVVDGQE